VLPSGLNELIPLLSRLPGVGEKTAQRYALFLITQGDDLCRAIGESMLRVADDVVTCTRCGHIADRPAADRPAADSEGADPEAGSQVALCVICRDNKRDASLLCVVHRVQDLLSIERSKAVRGYYFVLGKLLSPLEGIGVDQLPIEELKQRIREPGSEVREVLIATPPSVDGEATALVLSDHLKPLDVTVSRIASGVPHGSDLEYADPVTIGQAVAGRRDIG
jgi:recombination protein RecR